MTIFPPTNSLKLESNLWGFAWARALGNPFSGLLRMRSTNLKHGTRIHTSSGFTNRSVKQQVSILGFRELILEGF